MLKLGDFFHLPQVDSLFEQIIVSGPGLVVVAGLDAHPVSAVDVSGGVLPSGRSAIFRILAREILAASTPARAVIVAEDPAIGRIPRQLRQRIEVLRVPAAHSYADRINEALRRRPELLVIDHLSEHTASLALRAARSGVRVLSQLDTVSRGAGVARHLRDLGVPHDYLDGLTWAVTVQRVPTLCAHCRRSLPPDMAQWEQLCRRYPQFADLPREMDTDPALFEAEGCEHCRHTGRLGDAVIFDVYRTGPPPVEPDHVLPMEEYLCRLALLGHVAPADVWQFEADQFRRTYNLVAASQRALVDANTALERKLVELEAANRVLEQRTRALVSLQEIGQALIASTRLAELADRLCRHACELCGANRVILYFSNAPDRVEVLAVSGWEPELLHQQFDADQVFIAGIDPEPVPFNQWPPGIPSRPSDGGMRAGLYVPLLAQDMIVGLMIIHTGQRARFLPGEVALLQTFANQAALAIQRAGLIEDLRAKIDQLEAAQVELAKKERMERELELARQVQQSVLPRVFPQVPGFGFAAHNEPARQVGGDFYDAFLLDADHFGVAIADVSDKGMPAALYMALTRSLLLAEARRVYSPRAVLNTVNQLLLELGEPNMFVTVFYGVVDRSTGWMTYARAGHDRPLLLRDGAAFELEGRGVALGLLDTGDLLITEEELALLPGDRLVLYTDGLTDIHTHDGKLFDRHRLKVLFEMYAEMPPPDLCAAVLADLNALQGAAEQYDDMTLLILGID